MNNLLFFNKEGYPHNFNYNKDTLKYEGKIIFDENSDQTFKTQSIHIFEEVKPIEFTLDAELLELKYNNNSGLTIAGQSVYYNENILNITRVNESDKFYSKWIYGDSFHKKFPIGTVVYFNNIIGVPSISDFNNDKYYTVIEVKKNAILIITETRNDIFNFVFESGIISSLNMLSINDYNRNIENEDFFQNLYTGKKFSIIESNFNDRVVSIKQSGITYTYINELELNGNVNQIFTLQVELLTERPKLLQSNVTILNANQIEVGKFAKVLAPETISTSSGNTTVKKEVIFEDENGNKLFNGVTFIVDSLVTSKFLFNTGLSFIPYYLSENNVNTQWNTIQLSGITNIKKGDIIKLTGDNTSLQHNREFNITNVIYKQDKNLTILFTPDYIIEEVDKIYSVNQKLYPHQINTIEVTPSGDVSTHYGILNKNAYCYSTSNFINLDQTYISGNTSGVSYNTILAFINKYKSTLNSYGIEIYHTLRNNIDYLTIESMFGTKNKYFNIEGFNNNIKIIDDFTLSNSGLTNKIDIIVNEQLYSEYTNRDSDKLYNKDIPTEIRFNLNVDNDRLGFKLTLNGIEYFINFYQDTATTIDNFIDKYYNIMLNNGFLISRYYNDGDTLKIISDIDIYDIEVITNILSSYEIIQRKRNNAILLSGNEIRTINNLFDFNLSTGMIIKVYDSNFSQNNKEYNIIDLTENTLTLSYQGVFVSDVANISCKTREYLRKPRGEYGRDAYLRVYWEYPYDTNIDDTIFFYDISGNQLKPYNNIKNLTYTGIKPLISNNNTKIFLNKEPNKKFDKVNDPKYQQTIFEELIFKLEQLDSSTSYNWIPEPLEIFIGYNSTEEGVNNRTLKIERIDKIENTETIFSYSGITSSGSTISIPNLIFSGDTLHMISPIDFSFIRYGFEKEQLLKFTVKDQSKSNQQIFENVFEYKILKVLRDKIIIDISYSNNSGFTYFSTTGSTFLFKIEVQPKEILHCPIYGQTEIEDLRFKVNLNNLGIQSEEDIYKILYLSDIEDNAIDYTLFNKKRKEMLSTFREIYDYIGSYKSLVNAINYFGYNDLQLYEYYQNIDQSSYLYGKLHKILIPDIFDNSVEGWNEMDFINGKYQNDNSVDKIIWKKTNLFNLSYRITDENGNNVLIYTLEEVQYKLNKLKGWLRKNIIPISANLVDITGVSDTNQTLYQDYDESNQVIKSVVSRDSTIVNFNYTATLNFGSDYLVTVNFYILSGGTTPNTNYTSMLAEDRLKLSTLNAKKINYKNAFYNLIKPKILSNEYQEIIEPTTQYNEQIPVSFSVKIKTFYLSGTTFLNPTEKLIPVQYLKLQKHDLTPFTFNINKYLDPYIYIEVTTYDNSGNGLGYVNNKLFYYDEPRNHWIVNNNFDLTQMKYWQSKNFIENTYNKYTGEIIESSSTIVDTSVETNVNVNLLNNTYNSKI